PAGGVATPSGTVDRVASPTRDHLDHARDFLSKLDPALVTATREIPGAVAVVYAVLIGRDPEVRARQLRILDASAAPVLRQETRKMLAALGRAPEAARLPLMDLAVPSLRRLSAGQFQELYANVGALSEADNRIDLFELALKRALLDRVAPLFGVHRAPEIRFTRLPAMATGVSALLSGLAHAGHPDSADHARRAFEAGRAALGSGAEGVKLLPSGACTVAVLARALDEASKAAPALKAKILAAGTASVTWDRRVTMEEAELLRALGYALGCPTPPFIPGVEI
ncbi:MAG TPA: hypothetical protein VNI57_13720, partial [Candidatus Saccharimonadales bacterium]|nr:hypothetical protein [Candidatus Saccharimonadales bacterium]